MKKTAPGGKREGVETDGSSESREDESKLKEEAPSSSCSSSFSEELQGFTSASEIYSVRSALLHLVYKQLLWFPVAAEYSDINMYSFSSR